MGRRLKLIIRGFDLINVKERLHVGTVMRLTGDPLRLGTFERSGGISKTVL